MRFTVCVLARNEADTIEELLTWLQGRGFRPIVIDLASTDGTAAVARGIAGVHVKALDRTKLRTAHKSALIRASLFKSDWVVLYESRYDRRDLLKVVNEVRLSGHAVLGARTTLSFAERFVNRLRNILAGYWTSERWPRDWACGLRAYPRSAVPKLLRLKKCNYVSAVGTLLALGYRIKEVPITSK